MIITLFFLFFSFDLYSAGFTADTLLLTKNGQTTFDAIDVNTLVQFNENKFQPILVIAKQVVETVVQIHVADEIINCHTKQVFWSANQSDWICAEDLQSGDLLQTIDDQLITIDSVTIINQQTTIYSLTVGPPHHLYIGKHAVLAHNVPWVIAASTSLAVSTGAVEFIKASVVPLLSVIALKICDLFAKNRDKKKPKTSISAQPICTSPQLDPNDEDKNDNDKNSFFTKLKNKSTKYVRTKRFGKMYQDSETGLWWSKDLAQHGGSYFKVFKETAKSFEWIFNANYMGNRIFGQNKGPVGLSIPFKEVIFRT